MTTIVLADDHPILRDALSALLTKDGSFRVVASVGDAQSAVNACQRHRPHLLLLDLEMPGRDALSCLPDVVAASPPTRVVILTAFCRDAYIEIARTHGVPGYLLKSDAPSAILDSLRRILAGQRAFSPRVSERMKARETAPVRGAVTIERKPRLTPRELEVLRYIGQGMDNQEMAKVMWLSKRTVERHVARLMDAVEIRDRAGLVRYAFEQGLAG
jgi:DNA-binding NarL/FixJ family response regulator